MVTRVPRAETPAAGDKVVALKASAACSTVQASMSMAGDKALDAGFGYTAMMVSSRD